MQERAKGVGLVEAVSDLKRRTLASLSSEMAKLVYLSSTRDYLTGRYYHDGLAFRFTGELAEIAVGFCHHELFERIVTSSLGDLVRELEVFIRSQNAKPPEVLDTWKKLQPYRMLVPQDSDSVSKEFFFSNIRIALAILEGRLGQVLHQDQQSASPRQ
jgi:hypothetical protein